MFSQTVKQSVFTRLVLFLFMLAVAPQSVAGVWANNHADHGLFSSIKTLADAGAIHSPVLGGPLLWNQAEVVDNANESTVSPQVAERYHFYRQLSIENETSVAIGMSTMSDEWVPNGAYGEAAEEYQAQVSIESYWGNWAGRLAINSQESDSISTEGSWLAYTWGSGSLGFSHRVDVDPYVHGDGLFQSTSSDALRTFSFNQSLFDSAELRLLVSEQDSHAGENLLWRFAFGHRVGPLEYHFEHLTWQRIDDGRRQAVGDFISGEGEILEEIDLLKVRFGLEQFVPFAFYPAIYGEAVIDDDAHSWLAGIEIAFHSELLVWMEFAEADWSEMQKSLLSHNESKNGITDDGTMVGFSWNYHDADWLSVRARSGDDDYMQVQWKHPINEKINLDLGVQWKHSVDNHTRNDFWLRIDYQF